MDREYPEFVCVEVGVQLFQTQCPKSFTEKVGFEQILEGEEGWW